MRAHTSTSRPRVCTGHRQSPQYAVSLSCGPSLDSRSMMVEPMRKGERGGLWIVKQDGESECRGRNSSGLGQSS